MVRKGTLEKSIRIEDNQIQKIMISTFLFFSLHVAHAPTLLIYLTRAFSAGWSWSRRLFCLVPCGVACKHLGSNIKSNGSGDAVEICHGSDRLPVYELDRLLVLGKIFT